MGLSDYRKSQERQLANLRPAPPAPTGNTHGLVHGARAHKLTLLTAGSWAERIFTVLAGEAPLRDHDGELPAADRQAVELLASCLARLQSVGSWLEKHGTLDDEGKPRPALEAERLLARQAADFADSLGMTPRARTKLGLDLHKSLDLAQHWAAEAREGDYLQEPLEPPQTMEGYSDPPTPVAGAQIDRTGPEIEPPDELDALLNEALDLDRRIAAVRKRKRHG